MPGGVRFFKVQSEDVGPFFNGQVQPVEDLVHSLLKRRRFVVLESIIRSKDVILNIGSRPEVGGADATLSLGSGPDGLSVPPPLGVGHVRRSNVEVSFQIRIVEAVVNDSVRLRVQSGDDGVVIRESNGRIRGHHERYTNSTSS